MEWLAGGRLGLLVEGTRQFDPAASDKSRSIIIPSWLISGADAGGEDFAYSRVASPPSFDGYNCSRAPICVRSYLRRVRLLSGYIVEE